MSIQSKLNHIDNKNLMVGDFVSPLVSIKKQNDMIV